MATPLGTSTGHSPGAKDTMESGGDPNSAQESGANSAASLARRYTGQLDRLSGLCAKLESIADDLPDNVDTHECLKLSRQLQDFVSDIHSFEEAEVFAALRDTLPNDDALEARLERLRYEHWEDESFAGELGHCLHLFVADRRKCNIESLAWMLRGFFEGVRRHVAYERDTILPLLMARETTT